MCPDSDEVTQVESDNVHTWELTPSELSATRDKLAKLNERARKRGFTGLLDIDAVRREISTIGPLGRPITTVVYDVVISGEPPSYGGWNLLAAVDTVPAADGSVNYVVRQAPGIEESLIDRSILKPGQCQHCNTLRPGRPASRSATSSKSPEKCQRTTSTAAYARRSCSDPNEQTRHRKPAH